jgi:excisionase family DNA binding protein
MSASERPPPPRIALTVEEAAESLGVSQDFFKEYIAPELQIVRLGRRKLIGVKALEIWVEDHAEWSL